jgi:colanic acid/amylovoran biosynthesis protein
MNILVTDAFSSANRGDAAILDGILTGLARRLPGAKFTVTSRFPALTRRFHRVDAIDDRDVVATMRAIDAADLVVGCGGSYLHDTYALNLHPRLATIHACARAGKPFAVFAQSIGPLDSPLSRTAARNALDGAAWILVRDEASARVVRGLGVRAPVEVGVDAAVGGRSIQQERSDTPLLGVTVRSWHFPGHAAAAALQDRYERDVAAACDAWARHTGGGVRFLSNCTNLGGYAQDDRVAARRVAARMTHAPQVVETEDLDFRVVRGQAAACDLFLGTRMHSLIFATTAGVPAVGVGYEFKTGEWLDQVGLGGRIRPIEATDGLTDEVLRAWDERAALRETLAVHLPPLVARAEAQLDTLAALARGTRIAAVPARPTGRTTWNEETWRYDRPHRRLRAVVDAVVAESSGGRVLDLGCSSGLLGRMLGPRWDYTGVDLAPSVAADEPGFRVRTGTLDGEWPAPEGAPDGCYDVVTASGALEYADELHGVLVRVRSNLRPGGLAVVTLFNLAHTSRGAHAHRHPTWKFSMRPDELVLALREVGLAPTRLFASSAGRLSAPAVDFEGPTDLDRAGAVQLAVPGIFRLGHHMVAVCRAGEPQPGPAAVTKLAGEGALLEAVRLAVTIARDAPWSARVWSDLSLLWRAAGDERQSRSCAERAYALDPGRPDLRALRAEEAGVEPKRALSA